MNSVFLEQNYTLFMKYAGQDKKKELLVLSDEFLKAVMSGKQKVIKDVYLRLLQTIKETEESTGISIMKSSDGSYFLALSAFSGTAMRLAMNVKHGNEQNSSKKMFANVEEADRWLTQCPNIEVIAMTVPTRTSYGVLGSRLIAEKITLEYLEHNNPTGYRYRMVELEKKKYFTKADPKLYVEEWGKEQNVEVVLWKADSIVTRQSGLHLFESGLDRSEHIKLFIVYRNKVKVLQ